MDLLDQYPRSVDGNIGLLIIGDHMSNFSFLHPLKKFTSDQIVCTAILNDNGMQFKSKHFKAFLTSFGNSHACTVIYSPQAKPCDAYIGQNHTNCDEILNLISGLLWANIHRSTGDSPYYLCFGQNMMLNGKDYDLLRKPDLSEDDVALK